LSSYAGAADYQYLGIRDGFGQGISVKLRTQLAAVPPLLKQINRRRWKLVSEQYFHSPLSGYLSHFARQINQTRSPRQGKLSMTAGAKKSPGTELDALPDRHGSQQDNAVRQAPSGRPEPLRLRKPRATVE
jgi:hypothetical protein